MGMAASQARYLGLTARKTNVEYEGQQINQARTALANQSADLFNQLLELQVPQPPSTTDFTTVQYSYQDGIYGETIDKMTELQNDPDGYNYMVTHYHYADIYTGVETKKTNPQVQVGETTRKDNLDSTKVVFDGTDYTVDGLPVTAYDPADENQKHQFDLLKGKYPTINEADMNIYTDANGQMHFVSNTELANAAAGTVASISDYSVEAGVPTHVGNKELSKYDPTDPEMKAAYEQILADLPDTVFAAAGADDIYTWTDGGRTYFACKNDLMASAASGLDPTKPTENQSVKLPNYYADSIKTKVERTEKAFIEIDGSGRFTSIKYEDSSAVFDLTTETKTDDNAYADAMSQYNYDKAVYEKDIEDINAKTEKIQEQDRTLELRLRQLDTEQEALQTEMEAVKKVIDKNIESTFKTFE